MRKLSLLFVAAPLLFTVATASASIVYSSQGSVGGVNVNGNALSDLGDDVTLVGTDRNITQVRIGTNYFPTAGEPVYVNPVLTLTLYTNVGGVPGAVIASSTESETTYTGPKTFTFDFPSQPLVPDSFIWAISQDVFANNFQLEAAGAPEIGSSAVTIVYRSQGGSWGTTNVGAPTFVAEFEAVPEPATLGALALGGVALIGRRRRGC